MGIRRNLRRFQEQGRAGHAGRRFRLVALVAGIVAVGVWVAVPAHAAESGGGGIGAFFQRIFGGDEIARMTQPQQERVDAARKKLERARKALERAEKEKADAEKRRRALEDKLAEFQGRLAKAKNAAERDRILARLHKIEADLQAAAQRYQDALRAVVDAKKKVAQVEKEFKDAEAALKSARQKALKEIEERKKEEQASKRILEEEEEAQRALKRARRKVQEVEKRYERAKKRRDKYQSLLREAQAQVAKCRKDVESAANVRAAKRAERSLAKADAYVAELQGELKEAEAALKQAESALAQAKQSLAATEQRARAASEAAGRVKGKKKAEPAPAKPRRTTARKPPAPAKLAPPPKKVRQPKPVQPKPVLIPVKRTHVPEVSPPVPWASSSEPEKPALPAEQKLRTPEAQPGTVRGGEEKKIQFDIALVSGDKEIVERLKVWKEWADYIPFNPVSRREINEFYGRLVRALQEEGYVFAKVTFPTRIWSTGIFLAKVDCGPLGTIVVRGNRHYSARQIIRALQRQEGERFNYARIYADLFDLNTKPDIKVDTRLKPTIQDGRRVINAELTVRDNLPIHVAFEASNTGTKQTNDWRFRTTVQHLNLTKHDDVLTLDWLTSPDWGDVNAYSGSYFLPLGDKYSVNVYGGYSKSDIDDVMPQLDVRGKGSFFGAQVTRTLRDTLKSRWQLSAGWLYQHMETHHDVGGLTLDDRKLDVSMPSITLGYASRTFDRLGGRNFFSNTLLFNFAGNFGASKSGEFNALGAGNADGSFVIDRFQIARLQHFFHGEETPGKWSLFMKLEGQLASDTLIPELRKFVGGADTVRGYEENDMAGDQALVATLELRTPLIRNFIPGLKKSDEFLAANPDAWQRHRLQFLLFADFGYVDMKEPLPGEQDSDTLVGVGAGLRLGLTKYSQMRLDIGYPLEKTEESDNPRAHLSLQLQF